MERKICVRGFGFFDTRSLSKLTVEVEDDDVEFQENTLDIVVDDIMQETLASAVSKAKENYDLFVQTK